MTAETESLTDTLETKPPGGQHEGSGKLKLASRAVAWSGIYNLTSVGFGMLAVILTARLLTPVEYGRYSVVSTYMRYVAILALFALDTAILRYVPEFQNRGDRRGLAAFIRKVLFINLLIWGTLTTAFVAGAGFLSRINNADLDMLIYVGVAAVLPSVLMTSLQAVLTSFFAVKQQAIASFIGGVFQVALLFLLIRSLGLGGPGAMAAQIGMSGVMLVWFVLFIPSLLSQLGGGEYIPVSTQRLLLFSAPFAINGVAESVFLRQSQVLFLQPYHGEIPTAIYNQAYIMAFQFITFVPAMFYGVAGVLSASAILESREKLASIIAVYFRILAICTTLVSIGGFVLADRLADLLFSFHTRETGQVAAVLFLTQVIIAYVNPYHFVIRAEEKTWLYFVLLLPSAVISLGASWIFIPKYGLWGAVYATSSSFAVVTVFQYLVLRRVFPYISLPWLYLVRCYVACAPMLIVLVGKNILPGASGFFPAVIFAGILWLAGARLLKLIGSEEADLLSKANLPGANFALKVLMR